jgi:MFS family permease
VDVVGREATGIWANGDFRRLWAAATLSAAGDYLRLFAVPFLVFSLTRSALNTGGTLALETLPYLLVSPFAGVLADRVPRRALMIASRVAQLLLVGSLPAAYYAGMLSLAQVYGTVFALGCVEVVFGAASLSALPGLVAPAQLVAANSAVQLSLSPRRPAGS